MNKTDNISLLSLNLDVATYHTLIKILESYKLPFTVSALREIGLSGIYNFDVVTKYLSPSRLGEVLNALEKKGVNLPPMTEKEFSEIDFDFIGDGNGKKNLKDVLIEHNALSEEISTAGQENKKWPTYRPQKEDCKEENTRDKSWNCLTKSIFDAKIWT